MIKQWKLIKFYSGIIIPGTEYRLSKNVQHHFSKSVEENIKHIEKYFILRKTIKKRNNGTKKAVFKNQGINSLCATTPVF